MILSHAHTFLRGLATNLLWIYVTTRVELERGPVPSCYGRKDTYFFEIPLSTASFHQTEI